MKINKASKSFVELLSVEIVLGEPDVVLKFKKGIIRLKKLFSENWHVAINNSFYFVSPKYV